VSPRQGRGSYKAVPRAVAERLAYADTAEVEETALPPLADREGPGSGREG